MTMEFNAAIALIKLRAPEATTAILQECHFGRMRETALRAHIDELETSVANEHKTVIGLLQIMHESGTLPSAEDIASAVERYAVEHPSSH
jgi:hypothetical protein